jgi:SHS2 domain-containing protein
MFSLVADSAGVRKRVVRRVEAAGKDAEEIFVNWLSEVNFLHQIHRELYVEALIDELGAAKVSGRVVGEKIDPSRHALRGEIKGVTYHGLEVRQGPGGWRAKVLFDV